MSKSSRLTNKLKQRDFKLNALLELTEAINANWSEEELLFQFQNIVDVHLGISKFALYMHRQTWECVLNYGEGNATFAIPERSFFFENTGVSFSEDSEYDVLIPVTHNNEPLALVLAGDKQESLGISPAVKHMHFIQTLTSVLAVALENKRLLQNFVQQERLKKELELAAEMQMMLLPSSFPNNDFWNVQGLYRAHQQVGGDYYDVFEGQNGKWIFCIGDVSGKGMPAAFLMSNFQAYVRNAFEMDNVDFLKLAKKLNERVWNAAQGEKFITFFLAEFDPHSKGIRYINCGHNPVLLQSNGEVNELPATSIGLGMLDELPFVSVKEVQIQSGDSMLCYTDGLVEVEIAQNEDYGIERVKNSMGKCESAKDLVHQVEQSVNQARGENLFADDVAILGLFWK
jgi:sigma-B regulation protein RsbU (phosphoserine phosphatase)